MRRSHLCRRVAPELEVKTVAQAFQAANLLVFSPSDQPLGPETRLDISHESLLRQWKRLGAWIETETKSALSYRRLRDAVRSDELSLSDTHLAQAQEWLKLAHPNVHWAMRYDGATQLADSLFDRCLALIESSQQARRARLAKEQAAAELEQELLRQKVEAETQRARDAEAAAVRFRRRTNAALLACVMAVFFLCLALVNLRSARTATATAKVREADARTAEGDANRAEDEADKSRREAQRLQAEANRQNEEHYWQFAILARDAREPHPLKAAHLFLRGASALSSIVPARRSGTDTNGIVRDTLGATAVDQLLVRSWVHDNYVSGAQFSRDESRVLTWSDASATIKGEARLWDVTDPLAALSPSQRILELEVRSGATLNEQLNLRTLKFDEWQDMVQSPEYRAIEQTLPSRARKPAR